LSETEQIIPVVGEKLRQLSPGMQAPALFLPNLLGDLAGADGLQELGKGFTQTLRLAADLWSHKKEKGDEQGNQQEINQGNCPSSSLHPFFDTGNCGVHQIGEEHRKQESDQRAVGDIEKAQH
jgi:hypothetical protein